MRKRFCFKRQKRFLQFGILEEMLMHLMATPCPIPLNNLYRKDILKTQNIDQVKNNIIKRGRLKLSIQTTQFYLSPPQTTIHNAFPPFIIVHLSYLPF
jgi:serine--tRNA ligase